MGLMIDDTYALAVRHHRAGNLREADMSYRQVLAQDPDHSDALHMLGLLLYQTGQNESALELLRNAIAHNAHEGEYYLHFGLALAASGRFAEAVICYRRAIALQPDLAEAHNNLGNLLCANGRLDKGIAALRRALQLRPNSAEIYSNLANALKERGDLDEAIACFRRAAELRLAPQVFSNLLFTLHFHPDSTPQSLFEEHAKWNERFARPLAGSIRPHTNDRTPERRLRIGYVSPDFRDHPVSRFLLPLLAHHDRSKFEVFCYSNVRRPDAMTARIRSHAHVWRETAGLSDEQLAQLIREDRINILVDLAMHTDGLRLLTFARKPAPVQVTYLAYVSTTGLETMDYRLSDPYLDPPGGDDRFYSETSVRLPETYWCYEPAEVATEVNPLPAASAGHVTFGCFNHYCKVTLPTLRAWGSLLREVPGSRLILHTPEGSHRKRIEELFAKEGIEPSGIELVGRVPLDRYFERYRGIDIGLDPFPYAGGTTTCDALWMGVPVVSLAGQTGVARAGLSILSNVGLPDLVARNEADYVRVARELAEDLPRLAALRATLRQRMQRCPLMDAPRFARNFEAALRKMWEAWCRTGG